MTRPKVDIDESINSEHNRFHHADGKGTKTQKHRYERRKVKEVLHQITPSENEESTS